MVISTFHKVIKARHPEDSSRLKKKCQSQIPMTPSSHHWLFLTQSIPPREYWNFTSRDIQEEFPRQFVKCQCSINPPWQQSSFNTVWIHQYLYCNSYIMGSSLNPVHFPIWKGIHFIKQSIELQGFNTDQLSA
ncbi:hypothetical protein O181_094841 [Austropuccinia psidii MF-1]|uniref:Uncharacterized protein n=1 Tax=Austropuccinia psidii MF-1 TaxID=1389203 RepID=A0A9Q3PCR3_9BASI|nr:hypothetical protein [Austropuccinia psidii MF-1]